MKKSVVKKESADLKPVHVLLPKELVDEIDRRISRDGDLWPAIRSRPEAFAKALEFFASYDPTAQIQRGSGLAANQQVNA